MDRIKINEDELLELNNIGINLFIKRMCKVIPTLLMDFEEIQITKYDRKYKMFCDIKMNEEEYSIFLKNNNLSRFKYDIDDNDNYLIFSGYGENVIERDESIIRDIENKIFIYRIGILLNYDLKDFRIDDYMSEIFDIRKIRCKNFIFPKFKESKIFKRYLINNNL